MITPEYCIYMARYNAWQNKGLRDVVRDMDEAELRADRGAFFGSIMGTLNHLLWADQLYMSRFGNGPKPQVDLKHSVDLTPTPAVWGADRFRTDGRITLWAEALDAVDLVGDLTWYSQVAGGEMTRPMAVCVMQLFNHQTHHRGQVHQMLTAAGKSLPDTDIPFLPEAG